MLARATLTLPHTIQELRMNMGWLPALWAGERDIVLVEDRDYAVKAAHRFMRHPALAGRSLPLFLEDGDLRGHHFDSVQPWGWDEALLRRLSTARVTADNSPSAAAIARIRHLASRQRLTDLLPRLRQGIEATTCGQVTYATTTEQVVSAVDRLRAVVVKAPWSSSGRGIRYITGRPMPNTLRWVYNVILRQGGVTIEPYYNKVLDFAMEFAMSHGRATYLGLSLFVTTRAAYAGNLIADEHTKGQHITRYVSQELLCEVRHRLCRYAEQALADVYDGPFGVDMMVVAGHNGPCLLHPCVEVNLRRTMGHVALCLPVPPGAPTTIMQMVHDTNYRLRLATPDNNYVLTL